MLDRNELLVEISDFYLESSDFNGIPVSTLIRKYGETEVRSVLEQLIYDGLVSVVFGDYHPNPHIKALPSEPITEQIVKIKGERFRHACVYPTSSHLKNTVDSEEYTDRPFELCLALGEPQLAFKSFELSVLESYRNDPRYMYKYFDTYGYISIKDEFYQTSHVKDSDQILLQSFGISLDKDGQVYVAAFLRYLKDLSPEHQSIWESRLVERDTHLHPDYFRTSIYGDFPERISLYQAILMEMRATNEICDSIGRKPIFKNDFADDQRPREFGYLLRPTLKEYNNFVHLLDKMLSENINREFFGKDVPFETDELRKDGKVVVRQKGTLHILHDWLRSEFETDDWSEITEMIDTLRRIRALRQKPAHSLEDNRFDQRFVYEQRELVKSAYRAVKVLRVVLGLHPDASKVSVDHHLQEGLIWPI